MLNQSRNWQLQMQGSRMCSFVNFARSPHFEHVEEEKVSKGRVSALALSP